MAQSWPWDSQITVKKSQSRTTNRLTKAEMAVPGLELEGSPILVLTVLLNYFNKSGSKRIC